MSNPLRSFGLSISLLVLLTFACSYLPLSSPMPSAVPFESVVPYSTAAPAQTATPTQTIASDSASAMTPLSLVSPTVEEPSPPVVIQRCSQNNPVSLLDIGIDFNSKLLVWPEKDPNYSLWVISANQSAPEVIPNTMHSRFEGVSPNHQMVALFFPHEGGQSADLWISSIDGQNRRLVAEQIPLPNDASWVNNEALGIYQEIPLALGLFSTTPAKMQSLPDLGSMVSGIAVENNRSLLINEGSKVVFLGIDLTGRYSWYLGEYGTGRVTPLFTWLGLDNTQKLGNSTFVRWFPQGLVLGVHRPYGLDIASHIMPGDTTQNQVRLHRVELPRHGFSTNLLGWSDEGSLLAFTRFDPALGRSGPNPFYILDVNGKTVYNFCIDRHMIFDSASFSGDNRFVALTLRSDPSINANRESIILNVETGDYALLSGVEIRGWGELSHQ